MEGSKRITNLLLWLALGSAIILSTHCIIGGKLGHLLLAIYAYIIFRNIVVILVIHQPFMLEGRPLPAFLYLLPCPAPPTFWGYLQLYVVPIGLGLVGWIFGGGQIVSPITNSTHFWITLAISAFLHLICAAIIIYRELIWPYFGSLNERASFAAYLLSLLGILRWSIVVGGTLAVLIWLFRI